MSDFGCGISELKNTRIHEFSLKFRNPKFYTAVSTRLLILESETGVMPK